MGTKSKHRFFPGATLKASPHSYTSSSAKLCFRCNILISGSSTLRAKRDRGILTAIKLNNLVINPPLPFFFLWAPALQAMLSQNLGRDKTERIKPGYRSGVKMILGTHRTHVISTSVQPGAGGLFISSQPVGHENGVHF
jgi:hypothetical protein